MPIHLYQACNQDGATNISTVNTEEKKLTTISKYIDLHSSLQRVVPKNQALTIMCGQGTCTKIDLKQLWNNALTRNKTSLGKDIYEYEISGHDWTRTPTLL